MIELLNDDVPLARLAALASLERIGAAAEAAIPVLTAMIDEGGDEDRVKQVLEAIRGF